MAITRTSVINDPDNLAKSYFVTPSGITIIGTTKVYATYTDMINDRNPPLYASVTDATADPTVKKGGAIYKNVKGKWKKIFEEEVIDLDFFDWSQILNKPTATVSALDYAAGAAHEHANKEIIDGFSLDFAGKLAYDGHTIDVTADVQGLSTKIVNLEAQHNSAVSTITRHEGVLSNHDGRLSVIESSMSEFSTTVSGINAALATKADATTTNAALEQANIAIQNLEQTKADKTTVESIETRVSASETEFQSVYAAIDTKADNTETVTAIDDIKTRLTNVSNIVETKADQTTVDTLTETVNQNTEAIATKADADATTTAIRNTNDRITSQDETITLLTNRVNTNENNVGLVTANLTSLETKVNNGLAGVYRAKGPATYDQLFTPGTQGYIQDKEVGDVYHVADAGTNGSGAEYVWTGEEWEELGTAIDLSNYYTKSEVTDHISTETSRATTAEEELDARITAEASRATSAETDINASITTLEHTVTTNKEELQRAIENNEAEIGANHQACMDRVSDEETRAIAAETSLGDRITVIETTPQQKGYKVVYPNPEDDSFVVHANDWIIISAEGVSIDLLDSTADSGTETNIVKITTTNNNCNTVIRGNLLDSADGIILNIAATIEFCYMTNGDVSGWKVVNYTTSL